MSGTRGLSLHLNPSAGNSVELAQQHHSLCSGRQLCASSVEARRRLMPVVGFDAFGLALDLHSEHGLFIWLPVFFLLDAIFVTSDDGPYPVRSSIRL